MMRRLSRVGLVGGTASLVAASGLLGMSTQQAGAAPMAPRAAPPATASAYAVIATIPTFSQAKLLALANAGDADSRDDTLFVATDALYVYPPLAGTGSTWTAVTLSGNVRALTAGANALFAGVNRIGDDTLLRLPLTINGAVTPLATAPLAEEPEIAVTGPDDSVYVTYYNNRSVVDIFTPSLATTRAVALPGSPQGPNGLAVTDDTLYATAWAGNTGYLAQISLATGSSETYTPGSGATFVSDSDGRVLLGMASSNLRSLRVTDWDDSFVASFRGEETATWNGKVFGTNSATNVVTIAPIATLVPEQAVSVSVAPSYDGDIQVAGDGVAYVSRDTSGVAVLAPASASLGSASGAPGSTVEVNVALPAHRLMDDSTVTAVWWGDDTLAFNRVAGSNSLRVTAPAGAGIVAVVVALNGGGSVSAGSYTYVVSPPPPPTPSDPPTEVAAVAGDGSATVTWRAPASSGAYAVSNYLVTSSPGGRTCLSAALSCTVPGLSNGTRYTFTVKALTGAGWSPASSVSNAVTPSAVAGPSIVISGSREGRRVVVSGATTGFGLGGMVTPWIRLGGDFEPGKITVLVSTDGTFTWERRMPRRGLAVYFEGGGVRSNVVVVR